MHNKNHIRLYVSLLPLVIIVILILGAGYMLLEEDLKLPDFLNGEPKIKRLEGFPTSLVVTEDREKIRKIITNDQELNEFLNDVDPSGLLKVNEKINFDRKLLIGVATKTLDEVDHKFKIKKVYKDKEKKEFLISALEEVPGETCDPDKDKNIWIDLVEIDKTDWKIDFELVKKVVECK